MLSVSEALDLIRSEIKPLEAEAIPLSDVLGRSLAADIISGLDSPPFDKALMDGFAVRSADCTTAGTTLRIIEEVTAGRVPEQTVGPGQATQIMTGAQIPVGADAVVPVELASPQDTKVAINTAVHAGQSILRRGAAMRSGDKILRSGTLVEPQHIGLLAELGCHLVTVRQRPRIAILATGDELVPADQDIGPGQIRNSNEPMLAAQIVRAGGVPVPLGIARDEREHLAVGIELGLQADMLLLSGGVSAGKLDLVPSELQKAGVEQVFHKVRVKPGKPLWFGTKINNQSVTPVFGLPGNPLSSMVCFELFVRAAIRHLTAQASRREPLWLPLAVDAKPNKHRPTYQPAKTASANGTTSVQPIPWVGSADLFSTANATGVVLLPECESPLPAGSLVEFLPW